MLPSCTGLSKWKPLLANSCLKLWQLWRPWINSIHVLTGKVTKAKLYVNTQLKINMGVTVTMLRYIRSKNINKSTCTYNNSCVTSQLAHLKYEPLCRYVFCLIYTGHSFTCWFVSDATNLTVSMPIYIQKLSVFFYRFPFFQTADSWGSNMCKSWHGWDHDMLTETWKGV